MSDIYKRKGKNENEYKNIKEKNKERERKWRAYVMRVIVIRRVHRPFTSESRMYATYNEPTSLDRFFPPIVL